MKNISLLIWVLFITIHCNSLNAQSSTIAAFGDDQIAGSNHIRLSDGSVLIGSVWICDTFMLFTKVDENQSAVWSTKIRTPSWYTGVLDPVVLHELSDGSVVALLTGTALIVRISQSGTIIWRREMKDTTITAVGYNNFGWDMTVLPGDRIVVCGITQPATVWAQRGWIENLDIDGNLVSSRAYDSGSFDCFYNITASGDGGYTVIGDALSDNACVLHHFDSAGTIVWSRYHTKSQFPFMRYGKLICTSDNGYLMVGDTAYFTNGVVIKFDSTGGYEWSQSYTGPSTVEMFTDVVEDSQGFVITGVTQWHGLLLCVDKQNGSIVWKTTVASGFFNSIELNAGGLVACGSSDIITGFGSDAHLYYFSVNGNLNCFSTNMPLTATVANPFVATTGSTLVLGGDTCMTVQSVGALHPLTLEYTGCPVGIDEHKEVEVSVFPNPSAGIFSVSCSEPNCMAFIYNSSGALVREIEMEVGEIKIDLSDEADGFYFLRLMSGDREIGEQKLVVKNIE